MKGRAAVLLAMAFALAVPGTTLAGHAPGKASPTFLQGLVPAETADRVQPPIAARAAPVGSVTQAIRRVTAHRPPVALALEDELAEAPTDVLLPPGARAGDLVFRQGTEHFSDAVMHVDGGPYTHVGMLIGSPGNWKIIHATPPEVPGRAAGVVIDDLSFYLDPARARLHAVYGVTAHPDQRSAAVTAAIARIGDPFRLGDPAGTYCTELIWGAWKKAGVDLGVKFTELALPLLEGRYLLPGDLAASTTLRWLGGSEVAKATTQAG